jgi:surfeit locus 1 family protein
MRQRLFRPTVAGTLAVLLILPGLLWLGTWQLRRADEKRDWQERLQRGAATTQLLTAGNASTMPLLQQVAVQGRYDSACQVLLDNMPAPQSGKPGFLVLTPLRMGDGSLVLVNRGWAALGRTRQALPDVGVDSSERSVRGLVAELPQPGLRMGSAEVAAVTWPKVLNFPTMEQLRALYGPRLLPRIVLLDIGEPDGLLRDWSHVGGDRFGPDRHLAYAVQWFGLALTLVVIYLVLGYTRAQRSDLQ